MCVRSNQAAKSAVKHTRCFVFFKPPSLSLSFLEVLSSILGFLSAKLETNGCLGAKCLNLSKETQIDTLKES